MASHKSPFDEEDPELSLATVSFNPHVVAGNDMVPLQPSHLEAVNNDDIEASSSDFSASPSRKPAMPRSRAKMARKEAHRSRDQESKPLLRPAKDILSRIRHDSALKDSDFIIGYHDRHAPDIQEMDVSAWKGGGDVTDEEWIPQHRILYFRKKGDEPGRRVWDREKRIDRLFGSGLSEGLDQQDETRDEENFENSRSSDKVETTCDLGGNKDRNVVPEGSLTLTQS